MNNQLFTLSFFDISKYRSEIYGISILWIMLFHNEAPYPAWMKSFLSHGNMGCELFLFISGVSLYFLFQKKLPLERYLHKRILRLLVPIFTICSWEWLISFFSGKMSLFDLLTRLFSVNFWMTGNQQGWFLSFMLIAYLLYPFIYSFLYEGKGNLMIRTLILLVVTVILTYCIYYVTPDYYNKVEIGLTRFPIFILGSAFGKTVYEKKEIRKNTALIWAALILITVIVFMIINGSLRSGLYYRWIYFFPGAALVFLSAKLFSYTDRTRVTRVINRIFRFLGSMTIELYLIHLLGRRLFRTAGFYNPNNHLYYLALLCICILVSFGISGVNRWITAKLENGKNRKNV